MKAVEITIPGLRPHGWERARTNGKQRFTSREQRAYQSKVRAAVSRHYKGEPMTGAIRFDATFVYEMPPSWSKKRRAEMCGKFRTQTPDRDNLEKAVLDAIQGERGIIVDDRQVVCGETVKRWGDRDCVAFVVSEAEEAGDAD